MIRQLLLTLAAPSFLLSNLPQETAKPQAKADPARDAAVMEAVFKDLLTASDSPVEGKGTDKKKLYFAREPLKDTPKPEHFLYSLEQATKPHKLSAEELKHALEAATDLARRGKEKEPFRDLKPKDDQVVVVEKKDADKNEADLLRRRMQLFRANAPGYSCAGTLAVVRIEFPWSAHHIGYRLYVIAKRDGKWVVWTRHILYIL
jgi:hypothetical protein